MVVKCGASAEGLQRVRWAPLKQTSGLQGHFGEGWGDLAGNDLGTDSGWKQSRQNQTPLRGDETRSASPTAHLDTALAAQLHFSHMLANYFLLLQPLGASQRAAKGDRRGGGGGGARHDAASQVGATIAARALRSPLLLWRVWKHVRVFVAEGAVLDCGVFSCLGLGREFRGSGFSRGAGLFARSVLKVSRADQELRVRGRAILARGPDVLSPAAGSGCVEGGVVGAGRVLTVSTTDQGLRVRRRAILPSSGLYSEERRLGVSVLNPAAS